MKELVPLLAALTALALPVAGQAQAPAGMDRELFERAFGQRARPPADAALLDLTIAIDGRERGTVAARITDGQVRLRRGDVVRALNGLVKSVVLSSLQAGGADDEIDLAGIAAAGLEARYASDQLAIHVRIPVALHHPRTLGLAPTTRPLDDDAITPARLSALLNWRISTSRTDMHNGNGRWSRRLGLEGVVNADGWVLESAGHYLGSQDQGGRWRRADTRLVHDWPRDAVRLSAGDLTAQGSKLRTPRPVLGLALERRFILNPGLRYQASPQQTLTLAEGGQAEIYVNQRQVSNLHLDPGVYNLRDFPVASGANDVVVRVLEPGGRERLMRMSYFFEPTLLETGVHEFSYAWGAPLQFDLAGHRQYRGANKLLQAGHRVGLSPVLTAGLGLQADRDARLFTIEALGTSVFGNTAVELGHSVSDPGPSAFAWRLQQRIESPTLATDAAGQALILAWENTREGFTVPGNTAASPGAREFAMRYTRVLNATSTATLALSSRRSRAYPDPARAIAATWFTRLNALVSGNVTISRTSGGLVPGETALVAMLSWGGAGSPWFGASQVEAGKRRQIHDLNYEQTIDGGALRAGLTVQHEPGASAQGQRLHWRTPRFEAQARAWHNQAGAGGSDTLDFDFGSALVWTDDRFGVGAPVTDSFALIAPHARLGARRVFVDPTGPATALAHSDWLGAPVISNLTSYVARELSLEVENLPPSYDLGNARPVLLPSYRSGLLVPVGSAGVTSVTGQVLSAADGRPLALASGALRRIDGPTHALPLFTNRKGNFRVDGVKPGRYALELTGVARSLLTVTIDAEQSGLVDLGALRVEENR